MNIDSDFADDSSSAVGQGLVDQLAMLLDAVAHAASQSGQREAAYILANDSPALAHFFEFSRLLRSKTAHEPTLIEYARTMDERPQNIIWDGEHNPNGWPKWRRIG